jgi:SAM-dependent methyltransferase
MRHFARSIPKSLSQCRGYPASEYEYKVVSRYAPIASELARQSAIRRGEAVLEVGAGTGLLTRLLMPIECRLIATDVSASMLMKARENLIVSASPTPPMVLASVTNLPFADESFDALVASLTPLQDSMRALMEARRVLCRNGRISLSMWGPSCSDIRLNNLARRAAGKGHLPYGAPRIAVSRMQRLGFDVKRRDMKFFVEYESVDSYLNFRHAFGEPEDWSATDSSIYYRTLRHLLNQKVKGGGSVRLDWNITYLSAVRQEMQSIK